MLDFYGMKLADQQTGQIDRASNWNSRFEHLNHSFHNYLRITRILKCLGEVGLEHYKLPFVQFVLKQIYEAKLLTNCYESCCKYWAAVLRNDADRDKLEAFIKANANKVPVSRYGGRYMREMDESDEEEEDRGKVVKKETKQPKLEENAPAAGAVEEKKEEIKEDKNNQTDSTTDKTQVKEKKEEQKEMEKEEQKEEKLEETLEKGE